MVKEQMGLFVNRGGRVVKEPPSIGKKAPFHREKADLYA